MEKASKADRPNHPKLGLHLLPGDHLEDLLEDLRKGHSDHLYSDRYPPNRRQEDLLLEVGLL